MKNYTINFTMDEKDNEFIERMSKLTGLAIEKYLEVLLGVSIAEDKIIHGEIKTNYEGSLFI